MRTISWLMKIRTASVGVAALATVLACASSGPTTARGLDPAPPAREPGPGAPAEDSPAPKGKVHEQAERLREVAGLLDKAQLALDKGNKSLAEQLFSSAEQLIGSPEAVASVAGVFRDGAPPRVMTPIQKVDPSAPPQPRVAGSSEAEDELDRVAPPKVEASLAGVLQIDGRVASGAFGLITLEPSDGKWKPRTPKRLKVEQRNREFLPHLTAISVGSTVSFPNYDTVFHNVFSTSPVGAFDLGLYKVGEAREFTFTREGIVRIGCNLHANMSAFIAVVAAPAYVVTDENGRFSFKHMPPGRYKLKAWSERSQAPATQDVVLKVGKNDVVVGVAGDAAPGPQPDKFGGKRG